MLTWLAIRAMSIGRLLGTKYFKCRPTIIWAYHILNTFRLLHVGLLMFDDHILLHSIYSRLHVPYRN